MKKLICLLSATLILFCGCSRNPDLEAKFEVKENGILVNEEGIEYTHLANEGFLYYLGELEFIGGVKGERKYMYHLGGKFQTGIFRIKTGETDNVLVRCLPDSEWCSIYRKASLEPFDFSVDRCVRLEFVSGSWDLDADAVHVDCQKGLTDPFEMEAFLSDVRSQKSPQEAGLYDLIRTENGMLENCYTYGVIYGFFEEEPNLVIIMTVWSYNDQAYSIEIEGEDYVLPAYWLQELQAEGCGQTSAKGSVSIIK